jgi:hypothetical protein
VVVEVVEVLLGFCQKLPHPDSNGVTASNSLAHFANFIVTPGTSRFTAELRLKPH